jgi:protein arginine kinase
MSRNLADFPFPERAGPELAVAIRERLVRGLSAIEANPLTIALETLSGEELKFFSERRMRKEQTASPMGGVGISLLRTLPLQLHWNAEDHVKIACLRPGLQLDEAYSCVDRGECALARQFAFAFDSRRGYLTADPARAGTGFQASLLLFLPALGLAGRVPEIARALQNAGCAMRGTCGDGTAPDGLQFQICNRTTLGEDEATLLRRVQDFGKMLQREELEAREKLWEKSENLLRDRFARVLALLSHARQIPLAEAVEMLSQARLAAHYGILPRSAVGRLDRLLVEIHPCHLRLLQGEWTTEEQQDMLRAERLRAAFSGDLAPC